MLLYFIYKIKFFNGDTRMLIFHVPLSLKFINFLKKFKVKEKFSPVIYFRYIWEYCPSILLKVFRY